MAYRVSLSVPAETDAYAAFERIREAAPMHAGQWLVRLFAAIDTLSQNLARCPVIAEADELGFSARHLLYGKGKEEQHVRVLRIWHSSRDAITAADVEE